jgi:hypothetical protein
MIDFISYIKWIKKEGKYKMEEYKKLFSISIIFLFFTSSILPLICGREHQTLDSEITNTLNEIKKWTIMFYDDSDFFMAYHPIYSFSQHAFSGENLSVVILEDKWLYPAYMWHIDQNHNLTNLEFMGEINMGASDTLEGFVKYCKREFPAERYILTMYDHGMGWAGACIDISAPGIFGRDFLSMDEMQNALTAAGGVDILCFTAPCNMGAIESVYELRDCLDVYVGSEETSGFIYWPDAINTLCTTINTNPDISNIDLGEEIIDWIEGNAESNQSYGDYLAMSAFRTDKMSALITSIDDLSKYINEHFNESVSSMNEARSNSKKVGDPDISIDFLDFIQQYYAIEDNEIIRNHLQNISTSFNEAILNECHAINNTGDHGLSIYFPSNTTSYNKAYSNIDLDFIQDTYWDEILQKNTKEEKNKLFSPTIRFQFILSNLLGLS